MATMAIRFLGTFLRVAMAPLFRHFLAFSASTRTFDRHSGLRTSQMAAMANRQLGRFLLTLHLLVAVFCISTIISLLSSVLSNSPHKKTKAFAARARAGLTQFSAFLLGELGGRIGDVYFVHL